MVGTAGHIRKQGSKNRPAGPPFDTFLLRLLDQQDERRTAVSIMTASG
jgi:hypothetical protein